MLHYPLHYKIVSVPIFACIKWSFPLSLSKALGCKRVHDDRIAGVTFEENTSCNVLIVNEEYAWVGNPFSALWVRK